MNCKDHRSTPGHLVTPSWRQLSRTISPNSIKRLIETNQYWILTSMLKFLLKSTECLQKGTEMFFSIGFLLGIVIGALAAELEPPSLIAPPIIKREQECVVNCLVRS